MKSAMAKTKLLQAILKTLMLNLKLHQQNQMISKIGQCNQHQCLKIYKNNMRHHGSINVKFSSTLFINYHRLHTVQISSKNKLAGQIIEQKKEKQREQRENKISNKALSQFMNNFLVGEWQRKTSKITQLHAQGKTKAIVNHMNSKDLNMRHNEALKRR